MAIVATDIKMYLSGGSSNSTPGASLGGAASTTTQTGSSINDLWDDISAAETLAGDTEYRCIYVKNTHGSLTLTGSIIWIETQTPSTDTSVEISLGTSSINGTEQTVANESTAPTGTTFTALTGSGNALTIGDLAAGATKAIWIKRIVTSAGSAYNADSYVLKVRGETAA